MAKFNQVLVVKKEEFEYKGEVRFNYNVYGKLKGKEFKIKMKPADNGGYQLLDFIFEKVNELPLNVENSSFKTEDGTEVKTLKYTIKRVDEDGEEYELPLKTALASDKVGLSFLLKNNSAYNVEI